MDVNVAKMGSTGYWVTLWTNHGDDVIGALGRIVFILLAYGIARFLAFQLISRLVRAPSKKAMHGLSGVRAARIRALQTVLRSVTGFVLAFVAGIMILQAAGLNIVPLLTTASVAGLAIGFGAQKLVRDVISGFFILAEDQYGVGDYVTIGLATGTVEELGMRTTCIRERSGKLFIISNGDITQVCNHSRGTLRVSQDIALQASTDLELAARVLNEVGCALIDDLAGKVKEPFKYDGISQVTAAAVTVRITGGVSAVHQDAVTMELNRRIRLAFEENGVQLA
ncbi:MAG: mechanosensitive ion channel family protein [Armatimonadota bacterium]|nr:mechanosensitive ion channel family protein [bacterium]